MKNLTYYIAFLLIIGSCNTAKRIPRQNEYLLLLNDTNMLSLCIPPLYKETSIENILKSRNTKLPKLMGYVTLVSRPPGELIKKFFVDSLNNCIIIITKERKRKFNASHFSEEIKSYLDKYYEGTIYLGKDLKTNTLQKKVTGYSEQIDSISNKRIYGFLKMEFTNEHFYNLEIRYELKSAEDSIMVRKIAKEISESIRYEKR